MFNWRKPKKAVPTPEEIRIAGIYAVCYKLGLAKSYRREYDGRMMMVHMQSGRRAIYEYADFESASNVDWGYHIFKFNRYLEPEETWYGLEYD